GEKGIHATGPALGMSVQRADIGLDGATFPAEVYRVSQGQPGVWRFQVSAPADVKAGMDGYLLVSSDSPYRLYAHLANYDLRVGERIGLVAYLYDQRESREKPLAQGIQSAVAKVQFPDGRERSLLMFDDGRHADGAAGDGVFGMLFTARQAGEYTAQVRVRGVTPKGETLLRTSEHFFPVLDVQARLGKGAVATTLDSNRWQVTLPVEGLTPGSRVMAFAEMWGLDSSGKPAPAGWFGGLTQVGKDGIPLGFDVRWLAYSGVHAPFEVRNVRLQDADTAIPLAAQTRMELKAPAVDVKRMPAVSTITDEMRMGPRPQRMQTQAAGGKLMLVHGYCAGSNPWPTSDFSSYAVFQDYHQNRTHDQFAQLIRNYGAQFPSFGIVAHSQGGAAALHLYTYYWSGLDYSSGSRLIQSVGTPYQGTALAGNLALLGQIFGVGCGSNWDLTYDGAALWLSGIPSWARSRVHYWTTSDKDVWWRWDYCNMATDPILDDPEDGVVEKWAAQLSGATNHGHKTGWCHTSGMRDPAQTSDHSRNAEMNAYGNR
ncbi:MAG: conditioned medium factor, partial [Anaerolineae bacterium]